MDFDIMGLLLQTYTIALPILLGYIVWLLQQQKAEQKQQKLEQLADKKEQELKAAANTKGTMLLLRVQLIEYHDRYVAQGEIPSYAYENFCEMYHTYQELGGNGMVSKMYKEIQELHIRAKRI